jgi:hypothetical protein
MPVTFLTLLLFLGHLNFEGDKPIPVFGAFASLVETKIGCTIGEILGVKEMKILLKMS